MGRSSLSHYRIGIMVLELVKMTAPWAPSYLTARVYRIRSCGQGGLFVFSELWRGSFGGR